MTPLVIAVAVPGLLMAACWRLALPERRYVLPAATCFMLGGLMFVPAGFFNGYVEGQTGTALSIVAVTVAALLEELLKCLPPMLFLRSRPPASRGLILGLASGTGFAVVENVTYVIAEPEWHVAVARALSVSLVHATSTALIIFVICQLFKHEHHHRGAALGVAVAGVVLRRVALRVALRAVAPGVGRTAGFAALTGLLAGVTFVIGFGFVWFTVAALLEELKAEAVQRAQPASVAPLISPSA